MAAARHLSPRFSSLVLPSALLSRLLLSSVPPKLTAPQVLLGFVRSVTTEGDPEAGRVRESVPVQVAHELLGAGHRYLDVRTAEEFSAGHVVGATNIPYMFKAGSGMTKNPKFFEEVSSAFGKDDNIIVGCRSGKRSLMAASDLTDAGFTGITDIAGGYSAWVQDGLPSE